VFSLRVLVQSY